jgi:hypothetical protein
MFLHNLLNVLVQIANEMGLQKKFCEHTMACEGHKSLNLQKVFDGVFCWRLFVFCNSRVELLAAFGTDS